VLRWQLAQMGIQRGAIEGRIERGSLRPFHHGVYAVGHLALTRDSWLMAAVLACGPDALLSHRSAGELWGLLPRSARLPEVTRPGHGRQRPRIVIHRSALPADEVDVVDGILVTSPHLTILDLAGGLRRRELERVLTEAEVRGLTDRLSLPELMERYPRRRGAAMLRELLDATTPGGVTVNDFEEDFVAFLDAHRLPRPRFNATLPIRGRLLKVDCMWSEQRLIVELDGRAVHGTKRAFESDRERDRILLAEGWRSARVTWRQLRDEPGAIAADLRELLRGAAAPTL
jgi:very-short-patch-repair endonuclease